MTDQIAFIGVGNMGNPMADQLVKAGKQVKVYDVSPEVIQKAKEAKLNVVDTLDEVLKDANFVISMLPEGKHVKSLYLGDKGIIDKISKDALIIDCSTIDIETSLLLGKEAKNRGIRMIDAPVTGGVMGARIGKLNFLVGGEDEAVSIAKPLFDIMGQKSVLCGPSGSGQSAKICNNMILGATMIATCEAFALADKLNLSREKMYDVVSTSSGYSWSMNAYCPAPGVGPKSPSDNNYIPGFSSDLMLKDLTLSQMAAEDVNADTPMGDLAMKLYKTFVEEENGTGKDFSAMLPRFEKKPRN